MRALLVLTLVALGCGTPAEPTEITVRMRLPEGGVGATLTVGDTTATLAGPVTVFALTPPIHGTSANLHFEVAGGSFDGAADFTRDFEVQHLPVDTALARITFLVLALPDGTCGLGYSNVRSENGEVWFSDHGVPVGACGIGGAGGAGGTPSGGAGVPGVAAATN